MIFILLFKQQQLICNSKHLFTALIFPWLKQQDVVIAKLTNTLASPVTEECEWIRF